MQSLWSNASEQLRGQAATGQQQLSELLHSLAGELGEMASKSDNTGPLTALAKQAAAKGGEWSHWLANSEPADVLTEVRRFARRRPFVFLASAALAGGRGGRLGRGLMAANDTEHTGPPGCRAARPARCRRPTGVTTPPVVTYEEVPSFGTGEAPEQPEAYAVAGDRGQPVRRQRGRTMTESLSRWSTSGVPPVPVREERSIGELMGDVTRDLSVLLRQEVDLAKAELKESASRAARAPACWPAPASPGS